jgi:CrcB protein
VRGNPRELAAVFAGGFLGAIARVALAQWWAVDPGAWPWATFAANIAGAFILGYASASLRSRAPVASLRLRFLGTGFCGALTTFSTLQLELLRMLDDGHGALALAYAVASVAVGLAAVVGAAGVARRRTRMAL